MARDLWTADRRLYLNAAGKAVEADDPSRAELLVAAGNTIPRARAVALGLVEAEPEPDPAASPLKNRGRAPVNKLRTTPPADKTAAKTADPGGARDTTEPTP